MDTRITLTLSKDALDHLARAQADRGEDYGWNVYREGNKIPAAARKRMIAADDGAEYWLEGWDALLRAYRQATGEDWRY